MHINELAMAQILWTILGTSIFYISWTIFSSLFLSPLRKFPGPKVAALTKWWDIYHTIKCDKFKVIHQLHQVHGSVVRVGPNHLSVASPDAFRQVYVNQCQAFLKDPDFYSSIQPGIGPKYSGLFNFTNHRDALAERKDLQAKLSPSCLKKYEARFIPIVDNLIAIMKKKEELDLFAYFKYLMLDAIGDLAFDQSFHQLEAGEEHEYVTDFNNAFMLIGLQNTFSWLVPFIPYLPVKRLKDAYYGLRRVFKYAEERVNSFLKEGNVDTGTLMEAYLEDGQPKHPYSPWYIALSGHGFIVAGSESTAITLTYVVWHLIRNPEVQRELRNELQSLPKDYSGVDLAALSYLDAILKETLRIYPPAPSGMPRVVPPTGADIDGVKYPPKTIIAAQPYTVHRDLDLFPDPEVFRPSRWLDASAQERELMNRAFVPFSAGHRGCIGRGIAWLHMLAVVARLMEHFEDFSLCGGMSADDMELVERGALAKPKSTKFWVKASAKKHPGFSHD